MNKVTKHAFAFAGVLALGLGAARAQTDSALVDALVKKGVLSDQEAKEIRASEAKAYSATPASKLALSDHVSQLKLYGDARFRYEYIDETAQNSAASSAPGHLGPHLITNRSRYRVRLGADYTFNENFKAGFELETNSAADSSNQTFGSQFGKASINVGLVYLQWKPADWITLTGGKQRNPLYTTDLVWDPDVNPEGGSEVLTFNPTDNLSVGLIAGQFDYAENANFNLNPTPSSSVWMFVEQIPVQFNFNKDTFVKVVPTFTSYMGGGINIGNDYISSSSGAAATGGGSAVTFASNYATNDLNIIGAPGEVDWKIGKVPMRFYWDVAMNLDGHDRVQDVYLGNGQTLPNAGGITAAQVTATQDANRDLTDNVAWMAGVQAGLNKKKGDWMVKADFRQIGLGSVDPNINDSDWGESFLNTQGIRIASSYNFTDFLLGTITYYDVWAYKDNLMNGSPGQNPATVPLGGNGGTVGGSTAGTSTTGTAALTGIHASQHIQVDLQWKF